MRTRDALAGAAVARSPASYHARPGRPGRRLVLAAALAALLAPRAVRAHDFWVERDGDGFVVRYGHRGGEVLPIDAAKVKAIRCGDGASAPGRDVLPAASFSRDAVRFPGPCAVVSVFHDGGAWSLTPDGEVNLPRSRVQQVVRAWASRQYAKWVDARSPAARAVLGDDLEIVPVTDLARVRRGDKVTVRVLAASRPVADAVVSVAHHPLGETDSKGDLRLRVRDSLESISTSVRRPGATADADFEVLEASLTFEVGR
jgi:uncharacterized GH25 family protein